MVAEFADGRLDTLAGSVFETPAELACVVVAQILVVRFGNERVVESPGGDVSLQVRVRPGRICPRYVVQRVGASIERIEQVYFRILRAIFCCFGRRLRVFVGQFVGVWVVRGLLHFGRVFRVIVRVLARHVHLHLAVFAASTRRAQALEVSRLVFQYYANRVSPAWVGRTRIVRVSGRSIAPFARHILDTMRN